MADQSKHLPNVAPPVFNLKHLQYKEALMCDSLQYIITYFWKANGAEQFN